MGLTDNLVAYWKLEEASGTRNDSHGANHLTDNNTVTQVAGKLGNAGQFTAANSEYLSIVDNAAVSMGNIDFTLVAWVYIDSKGANRWIITKYNTTVPSREYYLGFINSVDRFWFTVSADGAGSTAITIPADTYGSPATGAWIYVVAWHDSVANTVNIQVNNGTVDSAAYSGGCNDGGSTLHIGSYDIDSALQYFDGRIDSVGIWKRVLTAGERTQLYNNGNGLEYPWSTGKGLSLLGVGR